MATVLVQPTSALEQQQHSVLDGLIAELQVERIALRIREVSEQDDRSCPTTGGQLTDGGRDGTPVAATTPPPWREHRSDPCHTTQHTAHPGDRYRLAVDLPQHQLPCPPTIGDQALGCVVLADIAGEGRVQRPRHRCVSGRRHPRLPAGRRIWPHHLAKPVEPLPLADPAWHTGELLPFLRKLGHILFRAVDAWQ